MDKFLSELVRYQSASITIQPASDGFNEYLEGKLQILVKGTNHTFVAEGKTIEAIVGRLECKYLCYGWASVAMPVVEVHGGVAEVVSGNVAIADFDNLAHGKCPICSSDLEYPWDIEDGECPSCHYVWTKEDE